MNINERRPEPVYTIKLNQEELDLIEAVLSNTSGVAGLANRMSQELVPFRTPRRTYCVRIGGDEYRVRDMGTHFTRVYGENACPEIT